MSTRFLLYGATGFVGAAIARLAAEQGLQPVLAGRTAAAVEALAAELQAEHRVFALDDTAALDAALGETPVVLHCAGPFLYTAAPMADACLRTGAHYLDITGELPVYQALAARDGPAQAHGVMLLPGVGFDVVPTDCLALHLKQRLPTATHLTLAFHSEGPAGLPPGTAKTMVEMIPYGTNVRKNGRLVPASDGRSRTIDFGNGPVRATLLNWGDIFMAYHSTGIPNIADYAVFPDNMVSLMGMIDKVRPLFRLGFVRRLVQRQMPSGSTPEERARTRTHVWGAVTDDAGRTATARLHGPEAGVVWTARAALEAVKKVLGGTAPAGFQTPAKAFGAEFALEAEGVTREDVD